MFREEKAAPCAKDIPSMQLISQTLLYAKVGWYQSKPFRQLFQQPF